MTASTTMQGSRILPGSSNPQFGEVQKIQRLPNSFSSIPAAFKPQITSPLSAPVRRFTTSARDAHADKIRALESELAALRAHTNTSELGEVEVIKSKASAADKAAAKASTTSATSRVRSGRNGNGGGKSAKKNFKNVLAVAGVLGSAKLLQMMWYGSGDSAHYEGMPSSGRIFDIIGNKLK